MQISSVCCPRLPLSWCFSCCPQCLQNRVFLPCVTLFSKRWKFEGLWRTARQGMRLSRTVLIKQISPSHSSNHMPALRVTIHPRSSTSCQGRMLPLFQQNSNRRILSQALQGLSEDPALNVNIVASGHATSVRLSTTTSSRRYTPYPAPGMFDSLKEPRAEIIVLPARVRVRRCQGSYSGRDLQIVKVESLRLRTKCTLCPETWMLHIRLRNQSLTFNTLANNALRHVGCNTGMEI